MPLRIKTTPIIAINTGINFLILARLSIEIFELKNVGAIFILFGFGMMLGIVGFVEGLTVIGYAETIEIGIRLILSMFLMLIGTKIYNGK